MWNYVYIFALLHLLSISTPTICTGGSEYELLVRLLANRKFLMNDKRSVTEEGFDGNSNRRHADLSLRENLGKISTEYPEQGEETWGNLGGDSGGKELKSE